VPKAFVAVPPGLTSNRETARTILEAVDARLAPHQRIAVLEFAELPKTTSGKIRRAELRAAERRSADTAPAEAAEAPAEAPAGAARLCWRAEELLGGHVRSAPGL
jgi:acetyl-CoA synthetase